MNFSTFISLYSIFVTVIIGSGILFSLISEEDILKFTDRFYKKSMTRLEELTQKNENLLARINNAKWVDEKEGSIVELTSRPLEILTAISDKANTCKKTQDAYLKNLSQKMKKTYSLFAMYVLISTSVIVLFEFNILRKLYFSEYELDKSTLLNVTSFIVTVFSSMLYLRVFKGFKKVNIEHIRFKVLKYGCLFLLFIVSLVCSSFFGLSLFIFLIGAIWVESKIFNKEIEAIVSQVRKSSTDENIKKVSDFLDLVENKKVT